MKENDSGKENNYTLICVWQLCFIPLARNAKIKGDIVESVLSAFNGVAMGCVKRQALSAGHFPGIVAMPFVLCGCGRPGGAEGRCVISCLWDFQGIWPRGEEKQPSRAEWGDGNAKSPCRGHSSLSTCFATE